jgi:hypothetical protein
MKLEAQASGRILTGVDGASFRPDLERVLLVLPRVLTGAFDPKHSSPRKARCSSGRT